MEEIILGEDFNQSIDLLPIKIKKLSLEGEFNQSLINLPLGLEELKINGKFNELINLPKNLKKISLDTNYSGILELPPNLEILNINSPCNIIEIPSTVKRIRIGEKYVQPLYYQKICENGIKIPDKLEMFIFSNRSKQFIDSFPDSIQIIFAPEKNRYYDLSFEYAEIYIKKYGDKVVTTMTYNIMQKLNF